MRTKNAFKNFLLYFVAEILTFVIGLIFPRFIILVYGSEINGLTTTISRLLSLITLIQAGAVGTAIYQMYKPVAENDYETQSAIIYSSKKYYLRIIKVYSLATLVACCIFGFRLQSVNLSFVEIFMSFIILGLNGTCGLYFNSIADIYISPNQKRYYLTISSIVGQVVHYFFLTFVLILRLHFLCMYIATLLGSITSACLNIFFYRKLSKGKITNNPANKNYVIPDRKYLMMSCVGNEAVAAAPQVIISFFEGLKASSVFSVYFMVYSAIRTILNAIQLSVSSIFGNLVKTSEDKHIFEVFDVIQLFTVLLGTVLSFCVAYLIVPFVNLYTSGVVDTNYNYPVMALLISLGICFFTFSTSFGYVATVYGLFKFTCKITLLFGLVGVVLSVFCVWLFGMPFVMIGLLFKEICSAVTTLTVLRRKLSWFKVRKIIIRFVLMLVFNAVALICFYSYLYEIHNWHQWVIMGFVLVVASCSVLLLYCLLFERSQLKKMFGYVKSALGR